MEKYEPQKIEKKWQRIWQKTGIFRAKDKSRKPKFYCLDMFPYPSAYGLHVGHLKGYTFSDVIAKKRRMEGYEVLHPMGWDAFGLPAENFAIKTGIHPAFTTKKAIANIKKQLVSAGFGYDWQREIRTSDPEYYRWTQWMFLKLYQAGLAYRKEAAVNFCPSCKTVLANEQVIDGRCERCSSLVEKKYLNQWFFKITDYAERLLSDLDKIDWPKKIKTIQRNWIGKSEGTEIKFRIQNTKFSVPVFTTRTDTLFGCTYVVIAPEHPFVASLLKIKNQRAKIKNIEEVGKYIEKTKKKTEIERLAEDKEKTGIELKSIKAINPVNNQPVPIFIADYVLKEYGTGAIMAVPAHDQRDFGFAKKYKLPVKTVITANGEGVLMNSGKFNGMKSEKAKTEITKWLAKKGLAQKSICYKLRDWLISRQRYWGVPIPIVYCSKCGEVLVKEKNLPIVLPKIKDFRPTGQGKSPLSKSKKFIAAKCPRCGSLAQRETDTMDTFVCSSWYFLRYTDPKNKNKFVSKEKIKNWLPVNLYIGGAEHAVMHLLYVRFFTKVLKNLGYIDFDEPFSKLFNQGVIYHSGAKMSKSKGNVITADYIIEKFGADTMRLYELFMGPAARATEWSDKGMIGCYRFLEKVWQLFGNYQLSVISYQSNPKLERLVNQTIKKVTEDIENFRFNTAVSQLMILVNEMEKQNQLSITNYQLLLKLLAPMAPHITEEIWQKLGHKKSIFEESWPKYNPKLVKEEKITLVIQVNGKVRDKIEVKADISEEQAKKLTLEREKVKKWIQGKSIKKMIFIKGRLINIVI